MTYALDARVREYVVAAGAKEKTQDSAIAAVNTAITSVDGIVLGSPSIVTQSDQVLTVGPGGQFATLNAALYTASKVARAAMGRRLDIRLLPGFVMEEQVYIECIDLAWVRIVSDDAVVPIRRSALTTTRYADYPAFCGAYGAKFPRISALFEMDDSGAGIGRTGFLIADASSIYLDPGAGALNCPMRGLHVANSSYAVARGTIFRNCGHEPRYAGGGAAMRNGQAEVEIRQADLRNSAIGLMVAGGGNTDAEDTDVSGCFLGIENYESRVRFGMGKAIGCVSALKSYRGGVTHARSADFSGATGDRAIDLAHGSRMDANAINVSGAAGFALYSSASFFTSYAPNFAGAGQDAASVYGGQVDIRAADLKNAFRYGMSAYEGAIVNVQSANATGAGTHGFYWQDGSTVNANFATGTFARTLNTVSRHGIAYGPSA